MFLPSRPAVAALSGVVLAATLTAPAAATTRPPADRTTALEARRVDRVPAPVLAWAPCSDTAECATAHLPLDYDQPDGPTTELALLRVKARDPERRIGSLFVNPGGPTGSATDLAARAPLFLSEEVLDRFDIVGVDPRGVARSENLRCFRSVAEQSAAYAGFTVSFPVTPAQERAWVSSSKAVGRACSTTGSRLAGAMSTAEVVRDMEVLRRSVGDRKLSYLGFSYGSVLGQYYANMFPDRIRALAIDGVVDPTRWVGAGAETATFDRIGSDDASSRALREMLARCDRAGAARCALADGGAARRFQAVARHLRTSPVVVDHPELGEITVGYADFIELVRVYLYRPAGYRDVVEFVTALEAATTPAGSPAAREAARQRVAAIIRDDRREQDPPYANGIEAFGGVICTDSRNPRDADRFPALAAAADRRAPYFGRPWTWLTSWCGRNTWTVQDEDAYRGPFTRRTSAPVLVVGNLWDPATSYSGAVAAARLLPNSRLLSSDSWGHAAYGTSDCASSTVDNYLLTGRVPARTVRCTGDVQPFAAVPAGTPRRLPPVIPPLSPALIGVG